MAQYILPPDIAAQVLEDNRTYSLAIGLERPEKDQATSLGVSIEVKVQKGGPFVLLSPNVTITLMRAADASTPATSAAYRLARTAGSFNPALLINANTSTVIDVPLSMTDIHHIDLLRGEKYGLFARVSLQLNGLLYQNNVPDSRNIGRDVTFHLRNDVWRELKELWGWPRSRLFEVKATSFPSVQKYEAANRLLAVAGQHLEDGAWEESIIASGGVLDAVFDVLRTEDYSTERHQEHGERQGWIKRQDFINIGLPSDFYDVYVEFTRLAGVARRPGGEHRWTRFDARMMLNFAATLAEHLGSVVERSRRP